MKVKFHHCWLSPG